MSDAPVILGMCGSLRPGSYTRLALEHALAGAKSAGARIELMDLATWALPHCTGRSETEEAHDAVLRLREAVQNADGFIWATPEYHGSFSGVLKNAIDLTDLELWRGKPIGLVGVSGGGQGAVSALVGLRTVGQGVRAWVLPGQVSIASVHKVFVAGKPPDDLKRRLEAVGAGVVEHAHRLRRS